jgi:hypothetical protein
MSTQTGGWRTARQRITVGFGHAANHGRTGVFRATYHFTATTRTTDYRFRAIVPHQDGYPWMQGQSEPVLVEVKP